MAQNKTIDLPSPRKSGKTSLEEAIAKRRSVRNFQDKPLSLEQIGQLFWAGQGITGEGHGVALRAGPSAGALYPTELYLVTAENVLHYLPVKHQVEIIKPGDSRQALAAAAFEQQSVGRAPASMVICAVFSRVTVKYGERGIRFCQIEAGHVAQNVHLQAVALGLSSVPVGAFDDEQVKQCLGLPADHDPLYIIPIGYQ